jgi:hypothetical protein
MLDRSCKRSSHSDFREMRIEILISAASEPALKDFAWLTAFVPRGIGVRVFGCDRTPRDRLSGYRLNISATENPI